MTVNDDFFIKTTNDHEYKMASLKEDVDRRRREQYTERFVAAMWAFGIVAVVGFLAALVYFWQHDAGQRGQQAELACLTNGGTWTSIGGSTSDVCLYLDKVAQ